MRKAKFGKALDVLDFSLFLEVVLGIYFKMPVVQLEAFHYDVIMLLQNVTYFL